MLWFVCIIGTGLIGLMVADQLDFLGGRTSPSIGIGAGTGDNTASATRQESGIDGIKQ